VQSDSKRTNKRAKKHHFCGFEAQSADGNRQEWGWGKGGYTSLEFENSTSHRHFASGSLQIYNGNFGL
jgi:hypothetical protein